MKQHNVRARRQGALERLQKNLSCVPQLRAINDKRLKDKFCTKEEHQARMKYLDSDEKRIKREIATLEERLGLY